MKNLLAVLVVFLIIGTWCSDGLAVHIFGASACLLAVYLYYSKQINKFFKGEK